MRDRQNSDRALPIQVGNVVRKPGERISPRRNVTRQSANRMTNLWPLTDSRERTIKGFDKLDAKAGTARLVPQCCRFELGRRLGFRQEHRRHRWFRRFRILARTSGHASPADSPLITRRARASISAAHSASTSAGSSAAASSKLASNSAATSARSSAGRVSASRSSAWARPVMGRFYTLEAGTTCAWNRRPRNDVQHWHRVGGIQRCATSPNTFRSSRARSGRSRSSRRVPRPADWQQRFPAHHHRPAAMPGLRRKAPTPSGMTFGSPFRIALQIPGAQRPESNCCT